MKWSPDSKLLLYSDRHRTFVSDILSIGSPGGLDSRVVIYRLSDGETVVVNSILPVGIAQSYGWIVDSSKRAELVLTPLHPVRILADVSLLYLRPLQLR